MSSSRRHKTKDRKAPVVAMATQLTKSRNMAEENMLRHKLKGIEDQRRRSILALREEEKGLIRDLETQRRGSLSTQSTDGDLSDEPHSHYNGGSRRNSLRGETTSSSVDFNGHRNISSRRNSIKRETSNITLDPHYFNSKVNSRRNSGMEDDMNRIVTKSSHGNSSGANNGHVKDKNSSPVTRDVPTYLCSRANRNGDKDRGEKLNSERDRKHLWRHPKAAIDATSAVTTAVTARRESLKLSEDVGVASTIPKNKSFHTTNDVDDINFGKSPYCKGGDKLTVSFERAQKSSRREKHDIISMKKCDGGSGYDGRCRRSDCGSRRRRGDGGSGSGGGGGGVASGHDYGNHGGCDDGSNGSVLSHSCSGDNSDVVNHNGVGGSYVSVAGNGNGGGRSELASGHVDQKNSIQSPGESSRGSKTRRLSFLRAKSEDRKGRNQHLSQRLMSVNFNSSFDDPGNSQEIPQQHGNSRRQSRTILSRSVNIDSDNELSCSSSNEQTTNNPSLSSKSLTDLNNLTIASKETGVLKSISKTTNHSSSSGIGLSSQIKQSSRNSKLSLSSSNELITDELVKKTQHKIDDLDSVVKDANPRSSGINQELTHIEQRSKSSTDEDNTKTSHPKTEQTTTLESVVKNSLNRNKIVLSPIARRRTSSDKGYVPTSVERITTKSKQPKTKRKQKLEPLQQDTENHNVITSDSNVLSNASKRSSLPDFSWKTAVHEHSRKKLSVQESYNKFSPYESSRNKLSVKDSYNKMSMFENSRNNNKHSVQENSKKSEDCSRRFSVHSINLDKTPRPLTSWSQRRRSIVFGENPPTSAREVLSDTHAQWEELGEFLGEIRKQHNMDQAKVSTTRTVPKNGSSDNQSANSLATLVHQRLLPRRHSESNILLLSHAVRGGVVSGGGIGKKDDGFEPRQGSHSSRRNSCVPPDHHCSVTGHPKKNKSSVDKLVAIHNVLQNSALSMADMESETF